MKHSDLNTKIATSGTKAKLKAEQDEVTKLQTFYLSYSRSKSLFEDDLMFQCFSLFTVSDILKICKSKNISAWTPRGLSDKSIKPPSTLNNSLNPEIIFWVNFVESSLKQDKLNPEITF